MIGVFNDVIDYFTSTIEKAIVDRPSCELKLIEELAATKRQLDLLRPQVAEWQRSREGNRRSTLLTKFNKVKTQVERGEEVVAPMSEEELQEFRNLQLIFQQKKKERDQLASKQVALNAKLDTYHQVRKLDPSSLHNRVEDLWKSQGLNRGKAFGGKFQGIDARPVMEKPSRYFGEGMKAILRAGKGPGVEDSTICQLCDGVAEVMGSWNDFFSLLQKEEPTEDERVRAAGVAKKAVDTHFSLVGNKTPKVHVAEAHAVPQYLRLPPGLMRLLVEHWVERNHQDAWKVEKQFCRVSELYARAKYTAAERHAASNARLKMRALEVNESAKRKRKEVPGEDGEERPGKRSHHALSNATAHLTARDDAWNGPDAQRSALRSNSPAAIPRPTGREGQVDEALGQEG